MKKEKEMHPATAEVQKHIARTKPTKGQRVKGFLMGVVGVAIVLFIAGIIGNAMSVDNFIGHTLRFIWDWWFIGLLIFLGLGALWVEVIYPWLERRREK